MSSPLGTKKKILIVSNAFFPENSPRSFRTTELVKEFSRQGHDVTLYTFKDDQHHLAFENQFNVTIKSLGRSRWRPIDIAKGGRFFILIKRVFRRTLQQLLEYPDTQLVFRIKHALRHENNYDLLISIAVPHPVHWGTAWARTKNHRIAKVWVADCGDPYMGAIYDSFKKVFYFKYFEKYFGRKADFISVPKITMRENYYPEFRSKIIEIPQGFRFSKPVSNYSKNPIPTFGFAGTFMITARNPTALLEHLVRVPFDFRFIVYTQTVDLLKPYIDKLGNKLVIRGYIPREQLLAELGKMDFLINIGYDAVHQVPSKLIDYFLTGRPVMSLSDNSVDPGLIDSFLQGDYTRQLVVSDLDQYRIENVCQKFLSLIGE